MTLRRLAPVLFVVAMAGALVLIAFGHPFLWLQPRPPVGVVILVIALVAAAVMGRAESPERAAIVVACTGAVLLATLQTAPDARRVGLENGTLSLHVFPPVIAIALFGALCAGAATVSWRGGERVAFDRRTRAAAIGTAVLLGILATAYIAYTDWVPSGGLMFPFLAILVGARLAAMAMRPVPVDGEWSRAFSIALAVVGALAALQAVASTLGILDLWPARNYGSDAPPAFIHAFEADRAFREERAFMGQAMLCVAPALLGALALARRARRALVVRLLAVIAALVLVPVLGRSFLDRPAEAFVRSIRNRCGFGREVPSGVEPSRIETRVDWNRLECSGDPSTLVIGRSTIRVEGSEDISDVDAFIGERSAHQTSFSAPALTIFADRTVTLRRILAIVDPNGQRAWELNLAFVGRTPFAALSPLACALPYARMHACVGHRLGERTRTHVTAIAIDDDETMDDIAARVATAGTGTLLFHTRH